MLDHILAGTESRVLLHFPILPGPGQGHTKITLGLGFKVYGFRGLGLSV